MRPPILIIPGHGNSGPGHWQSLWEATLPRASRVQMPNWDFPHRPDWVEALDSAVLRAGEEAAPVLVAHGVGCLAVVHWARAYRRPIQAALLVAPTDVEAPPYAEPFASFAPIPLYGLPFESRVVASSNDPFVSLDRARAFAAAWLSRFTDAGPRGHLNLASGHGPWALGEGIMEDLL